MKLGNLDIKDIYVGSTPAAQVYFGDVKVWPEEQPAGDYWGLCFTAEEPGATVSMAKTGTPPAVSLLYSTDASTWDTFTPGTTTVTLANAGDKMWLKAGPGGNSAFATSSSNYWMFVTRKANASGNIMSLLEGEQQETSLSEIYCFYSLFTASSTKTAPQLPATTLASNCYRNMFKGCTSLTSAPALPALTLSPGCYHSMFYGCTSLSAAPAMSATTLANNCCVSMFNECTSLTSAPELPATTLSPGCYHSMFYGCTSLSAAPAMSATTLANNCCVSMFNECTSLTSAPELPATTLANYCYNNMFQNCSSLTSAPELPATTLASNCYRNMFQGCTSLLIAPALPATTLAERCYSYMFQDCTALQSVSASFSSWGDASSTGSWLVNVSFSGTFYCPTALGTNATIARGNDRCPFDWTVVNTDA